MRPPRFEDALKLVKTDERRPTRRSQSRAIDVVHDSYVTKFFNFCDAPRAHLARNRESLGLLVFFGTDSRFCSVKPKKHDRFTTISPDFSMTHWVFWATGICGGLLVGSFLNVVIHRGPVIWGLIESATGRSGGLVGPRSYCPSCRKTLKAAHLVPVVSYLLQRGRCAYCDAAIASRYPAVEIAGAGAAALALAVFGITPAALAAACFFWLLIPLAVIDWELQYLPDALTAPLIGLGLFVNALSLFVPFSDALIGAIAGYAALAGVAWTFKKLRGKDGLGLGDAKLLAGLGAWCGWASLAPIVFIASLSTLLLIGALHLAGQAVDRETPIPFGPALAVAGALVLAAIGAGLDPSLAAISAP